MVLLALRAAVKHLSLPVGGLEVTVYGKSRTLPHTNGSLGAGEVPKVGSLEPKLGLRYTFMGQNAPIWPDSLRAVSPSHVKVGWPPSF
jgi:hypothetical protein